MLLVNSNNSGDQERQHVRSLVNRQVSGLLVASAVARHERDLRDRRGIPTVIINTDGPVPGFHTDGPDFHRGARSAVEDLLDTHQARTVALATGPLTYVEANSREQGWLDALSHHDRPRVECWKVTSAGRAATRSGGSS